MLLLAFWGYGFAQVSEPSRNAFVGEPLASQDITNNSRGISANLFEGFEGTDFPPAEWTVINGGGPGTWERSTAYSNTGSASAKINWNSVAHNDWLITPALMPATGNATFSFYARNASEWSLEKCNIKLSTTGVNESDFTVTLASNVTPPPYVFTQFTYDLTAYAGQTVYLAIQAISTNESALYIDDVSGPTIASSSSFPEPVTNVSPTNGAVNVANGDFLNWTFGANTSEYEVVLGTTNPPTTVVKPYSSNLATSYELAGMLPNTQHYWRVNARNASGSTEGPIWNFKSANEAVNTSVDVTVTLNSGGSPMGTVVTFTNTSEPSLGLIYTQTLGLSGKYTWEEFRKGTYTIDVVKAGNVSLNLTGVAINTETSFNWILNEMLTAPIGLNVTPTGLATWTAGSDIPFEPFVESFDGLEEGALPVGWTKSPATPHWGAVNQNNSGGTAPEMRFNFYPSTTGTFTLKTPAFSTVGQSSLELSFKNYLNDYKSGYTLKVISIADGQEHTIQEWVSPTSMTATTLTYELTEAHGLGANEFQLAWVFTGNSQFINDWRIDDVKLIAASKSPKAFTAYKVYHQGQEVANVTDTRYQFGSNGENLVEGQTYLAEVSAKYTTGESAKVSYNWTYKSCGSYATPGNFAAAQVVGTNNASLSWTIPTIPTGQDQIDFARITRNGQVIAETESASYMDADLAIDTYTYCITFVYESGAETCPGTICKTLTISDKGLVNGNVKQAAYMGGNNIEGAVIILTDVTNPAHKYTILTNASGNYTADIDAGTYNYKVSSIGYLQQTLENVVVPQTATVTRNFVMHELPFPAVNIAATELNDNAVKVSWDVHSASIAEWLSYDDGIYTTAVGGPPAFAWAIKFDPEQLVDYAGSSLTKISIFNITDDVNTLIICEGPNAETQLYEQELTDLPVGQWAEVMLNFPIDIKINKELWITVFTNAGSNYPAAAGADQNQPNGNLLTIDGVTWQHIPDVLPVSLTWNLRGFVTDMRTNKTMELAQRVNSPVYEPSAANTAFEIRKSENPSVKAAIHTNTDSRELQGFDVYRTTCATGELQLLGNTTLNEYTDNTWGTAPYGAYKWGVVAKYNENNTEVQFSNCLDKAMLTQVSVTVTTDAGDSAEGTKVTFTNTSEPELALVYELELDETGYFAWEEFRKGTYNIHVEKRGFAPVSVSNQIISSPENFVWVLNELIFTVADLHVTPTATATWREGAPIIFEPFVEDFSNGIDHWTRYPLTTNWQLSQTNLAGGEAPEVRFYWNPNSIDKFYFISPKMNTFSQTELEMSFKHAINEVLYGDSYSIKLITIIDGVERLVIEFDDNNLPATEVFTTLTAEHGVGAKNFQIAFVYEGNAYNMNWWNIDDIRIDVPQNKTRELQTYKVWLDGVYVGDTPDNFYQHNVNELVEGQQYYTEVAAQYTSGMSQKTGYTWTYIPCDNFAGPIEMDYEITNLIDVVLNWSGNAPAIGDFYEDFEAGTIPTGWKRYDVDGDGYVWDNTKAEFPDFEPHSGMYCMTSASYVNDVGDVAPDNWLVTPGIEVTAASKLKFWVSAQDPIYPRERYKVKISTTGNAVEDFTVTLREAWSRMDWSEVIIDLSAYAGETVYIAFQHITPIDVSMYYIKLDDVTVTHTYTRAAYTPPAQAGFAQSIPFKTQNMTQHEIEARLDAMPALQTKEVAGNRLDESEYLGTNIYRDGELIAENVIGQTFTDIGVETGEHEYCINYVYTNGAMSCTPLCIDILVTGEDCVVPYNLRATDDEENGEVFLKWNHGGSAGEYLYYGNGVYTDAFGLTNFSPFTVAIQFDPAQLTAYDGKVFSKINFFYGFGSIGKVTLQIWRSISPSYDELIMEEVVSSTITAQSWNEIELARPVLIDATKSYKIGYTVEDYDGHPVGVQYYTGIPNSDLLLLDGEWAHFSNILPYAWLLETYVSIDGGETGDYLPLTSNVKETSGTGLPVAAPSVDLSRGNKGKNSRVLYGYNVYKDGELLEALWPETTYTYQETQSGTYCYTVSAEYEYCEETAHSAETCLVVVVDVETRDLSGIKVYPNPTNSNLNIELTPNVSRVVIYNYLGQVVLENKVTDETLMNVDVRNFDSGAYLIRFITNDGQSHTKKVMVTQ